MVYLCSLMSSSNQKFLVFSWNTRGLGDHDKCKIVRDAIHSAAPSVACLQETKLHELSLFKAKTFLPPNLSSSYDFVPADGARGGILTAWDRRLWTLSSSTSLRFSFTTAFASTLSDCDFTVTNVYAPLDHHLTPAFLDELLSLLPTVNGPWVIIGDFNLIRSPEDKNNDNINLALLNAFNQTIEQLAVLELPLLGHSYT